MNKINNLIENNIVVHSASLLEDIERIMKEYAEYYAQKCLETAATEAKTELVVDFHVSNQPYSIDNMDSILNIKLPEHE